MTQQNPYWWQQGIGQYQNPWGGVGQYQYPNSGRPGDAPPQTNPYNPANGGVGQYQNPWGGVGMYQYPNSGRPGDNPNYSTLNPQAPINPFMPQLGNPFAGLSQFGQMSPQQLGQGLGWSSPLNTPTPTLRPPFQSQAPFTEYGAWNMQTPPPGVGRGQPGAAWQPGYQQSRPPSWNAPNGPAGPGGGQGGGQNPNGGPWWTDPYGNQSFSGFDWNQVVPWGNAQYTPGGPSPFAGQPVGAWEDITNNLRTMGYLDQQAFNNQQQGVQNSQWDQTFGANQAQQGVQNSQWDRNFGANQAQNAFQNQLARDQYNTGVGQWDRNFNAQQGQQGWQNNFQQNEANRAADQWGQTFGANQAQQGWNNQFQTGRANAADSQWGQTFGANENQRGIENTRNAALDQWNQAFSQAGFDWRKQQDTEQNRLQDQGQNLAAFGRRFGPNVSYM